MSTKKDNRGTIKVFNPRDGSWTHADCYGRTVGDVFAGSRAVGLRTVTQHKLPLPEQHVFGLGQDSRVILPERTCYALVYGTTSDTALSAIFHLRAFSDPGFLF
jgi:hypothetical protein